MAASSYPFSFAFFSTISANPKSPTQIYQFSIDFSKFSSKFHPNNQNRLLTRLHVSSPTNNPTARITPEKPTEERVFFDGGAHYGDLLSNLLLGFTLLWMPLTIAAVFRAFFLRYRFTNLRVTVISGLTGNDRSDFSYKVVKDVQVVPRFVGEWGDIVITLNDGTKVDLRSVPKFREVADYCLFMADKAQNLPEKARVPKGF
ncbi:hypothetical protein AMTRI_Chr04g252380 [Amborella trichopoda]|uniref:YdbS-like PH domain-containing protein n=1 Tax=Amborella trichopoda TaxID=13333 RepID=W1NFU5_AMBTC|nr:uncharacterized protein LOC18422371 [Amborella trichopoda]ERM94343.1 hypothetical protein AMTR_s00010p00244200 [Amborella trichopoda]|eukprot:XP_006827106.1 uncharacterized protein LOC18422371 [Amborella trichopoda]